MGYKYMRCEPVKDEHQVARFRKVHQNPSLTCY